MSGATDIEMAFLDEVARSLAPYRLSASAGLAGTILYVLPTQELRSPFGMNRRLATVVAMVEGDELSLTLRTTFIAWNDATLDNVIRPRDRASWGLRISLLDSSAPEMVAGWVAARCCEWFSNSGDDSISF